MKKHLLCAAAAALLLGGISAGAASAPTAGQLLQTIPAEERQKAQSGTLSDGQTFEGNGFTVSVGKSNGACCILGIAAQEQSTDPHTVYGVFDFAAGKWRISCIYDSIYPIPNHRYFLVVQGEEKSTCYEAEADGTVNPDPLPIDGKVCGVDEEGYVTLYRTVKAKVSMPYSEDTTVDYYMRALLDNHYQMILDYVAGSEQPAMIGFQYGLASFYSGGTSFSASRYGLSWDGATYGRINRKGEWVGSHNYTDVSCFLNSANARVWATQIGTDKLFWLVEDGGEVALPLHYLGGLSTLVSDWAKASVTQAKARGIVPERMQEYCTLDIYREELCSLLMNLYRALGRQAPSLVGAPTFNDCGLLEDSVTADIRAAASLKLLTGDADGNFHPRSRITREEAAAVLSRFAALFQKTYTSTPGSGVSPQDYYTIEQAISEANRLYDLLK